MNLLTIKRFRSDGHILLPGLASREEVDEYRPAILSARERYGQEPTRLEPTARPFSRA